MRLGFCKPFQVGGMQLRLDRIDLLGHWPSIGSTSCDLPGFMEDLPSLVVVKRVQAHDVALGAVRGGRERRQTRESRAGSGYIPVVHEQ